MIIICILIAAVICLAVWQRDNISAVMSGLKYSDEDIQQQIDTSKKDVETELEKYNVSGLRDFTFEEEEAIRKGQLTVEEAVEKILSQRGNQQSTGGESSSQSTGSENVSSTDDSSAIVSEYTIKLYSLKAEYLGQIGNLIDQAKADNKNGMSAGTLMSTYLGKAASLESEADSQVEALLSELKGKLEDVGADTSIISTMRSSYENEKTLKKSYYLSLFNKKK